MTTGECPNMMPLVRADVTDAASRVIHITSTQAFLRRTADKKNLNNWPESPYTVR